MVESGRSNPTVTMKNLGPLASVCLSWKGEISSCFYSYQWKKVLKNEWCSYSVKSLFFIEIGYASTKERWAKNKKEVWNNGTQKRVFKHMNLPLMKSKQCDYQLCCITTCCIKEPSHCDYKTNFQLEIWEFPIFPIIC